MSTFTNWNGPQGQGPSMKDITELITAYTAVRGALEQHIREQASSSTVHRIREFVEQQIAAIPAPNLTGYATERYVAEQIAAIPDPDLSGYVQSSQFQDKFNTAWNEIRTNYATVSALNSYMRSNEFGDNFNAMWDSIKSNYALASSLDNYTRKTDYTKHVASHVTGPNDELELQSDLLINDHAIRYQQGENGVLIKFANDIGGKRAIQIGNAADIPVFRQRAAYYDETNHVLRFYPLQDELGYVPVGGMIGWPKEGNTLEELGLDPSGEWQPCNGASVPSGDEFNEYRSKFGNRWPNKPGFIVHAKSPAQVSSSNMQGLMAMPIEVLESTLQELITRANSVISKYERDISQQNSQIAVVERDYATKEALQTEASSRASAVQQITSRIDTEHAQLRGELGQKATTYALETEAELRRNADNQLRDNIINEHIGAHNKEIELEQKIKQNTAWTKGIAKQSIISFVGAVSELPTETPTAEGIIIQDGQKLLLNDAGVLSMYKAHVTSDNKVTWEPIP